MAADARLPQGEADADQDVAPQENRRMFWENSLYKFDHSARDAEGAPIRKRDMMAEDSTVRAPELYNPKAMLVAIREEEIDESGEDRHVESEDRLGAEVRDVEATIVKIIDSAEVTQCKNRTLRQRLRVRQASHAASSTVERWRRTVMVS